MAKLLLFVLVAAAGCASSPPVVGYPVQDVSPARHPNLAAAQDLIARAFAMLDAAQAANQRQLGGHAEQAKALLVEAAAQIKLAAEVANAR